jgi:phenylacetate-CoA ligase
MMTRCKIDQPSDIVSIYGTADAGVLGCETLVSIALRRQIATASRKVCSDIFGRDRLPTLVQYDPRHRLFETTEDGIMIFTTMPDVKDGKVTYPVAPLVRYNIGDAGGLYTFSELISKLSKHGITVPEGLSHYKLPFAFVFGRAFWVKSLYGANVYVENIMVGLENERVAGLV